MARTASLIAALALALASTATAFTPRSVAPARSGIVMMARGKANKLSKGSQTFNKEGLLVIQGFTVPKDAKCVDDVVGPNGSAGTKLNVAAGLREAGRPLPLVLRPVLTPEEKEAKQQLRKNLEYGNLVFAAIFLYNLATTAVNNEHPWNYSGNNDAICAQMAANGEESKMCTSWNADYIKAPKTERPAGVDLTNSQKAAPKKTSGDALGFLFAK